MCDRECTLGYLRTETIPLADGEELTEGRILQHIEFCERVGDSNRVKLCPCACEGAEALKRWELSCSV